MSTLNSYLLAFDHSLNRMIHLEEFGTNVAAATDAYAALEARYRDRVAVDIVLVGSDSIETVRVTHSTYFKDGARKLVETALNPGLELLTS